MAGKTKKHLVRLDIGAKKGLIKTIGFRYSRHDIKLSIYRSGACARYSLVSVPEEFKLDLTKNEIAKKALLLLLIETGRCNERYTLRLYFDGKRKAEEHFHFIKKIEGCGLSEDQKEGLEHIVISNVRSEYPSSVICFQNYALGSSGKTLDRFEYLFQGFNTFYQAFFVRNEDSIKQKLGKSVSEAQIINEVIGHYCSSYCSSCLTKSKSASVFRNVDISTDEIALQSINRELAKGKLNCCVEEDELTAWLFRYAYYLRCNVFHGERLPSFVVPKGDIELKNVNRCNELLFSLLRERLLRDLVNWNYLEMNKKQS